MTIKAFNERLNYQLLDSFVAQTSTVILGHLLVGAINFALFWNQINHLFMVSWACFVLLVVVCRWFMTRRYKQNQQLLTAKQWWALFAISSLSLGLVWMVWSLYVSSVIDLHGTGISILLITASGLVAGAVASTSSSIYSYLCFSIPILLPLSAVLLMNDEIRIQGIGLLMVAFFIITLRQVLRIHRVLRESILNGLELEASKEETEKLARELYKISTMDALTSVINRRGFNEALSAEWSRAIRARTPLTLLMIDVDYFKPFNDTLGHPAGDECLRLIAAALPLYVRRAGETIARYGGEEFAVLLPNTAAPEGVKIAEDICEGVARLDIRHPASEISERVTISIGVCGAVPGEVETSHELIRLADKALYQAKNSGRNCVRSYNASVTNQ